MERWNLQMSIRGLKSLHRAEPPILLFTTRPTTFLTLYRRSSDCCWSRCVSDAKVLSRASCTISYTENACLVYQEERRRPLGPRSQNAYKLVLHTVTRKLLIAIQ